MIDGPEPPKSRPARGRVGWLGGGDVTVTFQGPIAETWSVYVPCGTLSGTEPAKVPLPKSPVVSIGVAATLPVASSTWISNLAAVQLQDAARTVRPFPTVNDGVVADTLPLKVVGVGVDAV